MQSMTPEQLKEIIDNGNAPALIDVRETWEYEICRIDSSQNIPMSEIIASVDKLDQAAETVIICHHGTRSLQVGDYLESIGYKNIKNLEGGIDAWSRSVAPDMPQY